MATLFLFPTRPPGLGSLDPLAYVRQFRKDVMEPLSPLLVRLHIRLFTRPPFRVGIISCAEPKDFNFQKS